MQIFNELTNKEIEEALLGGTDKLWEVFNSLDGDKEFNDLLQQVKYGLDILFDIRLVTKGYAEEKVAFKIVTIGRKLDLDIHKYWDEIEKREKIAKEVLRSLYDDSFDSQIEENIEE